MTEYLVRWEINIWADSPQEAAEQARAYQLNPEAQVGAFHVFGELGHRTEVDLDEEMSVEVPEPAMPEVVDLVAELRASIDAAKDRRLIRSYAAKALAETLLAEPPVPADLSDDGKAVRSDILALIGALAPPVIPTDVRGQVAREQSMEW